MFTIPSRRENCRSHRKHIRRNIPDLIAVDIDTESGLALPFFPLQSQFHCSLVERFVFEVDFSQDGLTAFAPVLEGNARNLHGKKFKSGLCFGSRSGCGGFCFRRPRIGGRDMRGCVCFGNMRGGFCFYRPRIGGGCNMCGCICFRSRRGGLFRFRRRRRGRGRFFFGSGRAAFFRRPIKNSAAAITIPQTPAPISPSTNSGIEEIRNSAPTPHRINTVFS